MPRIVMHNKRDASAEASLFVRLLSRVIRLDAERQQIHRAFKCLLLKHIGDAYLVPAALARLVEAAGSGEHDRVTIIVEFLQQPFLERLGVVNGQRSHEVERALRALEYHIGDLA